MKASLFCEKANLLQLQVHTLTASTHSVSSWPPPFVGAPPPPDRCPIFLVMFVTLPPVTGAHRRRSQE